MNDEFRADLHCHSIYSDGSDTPLELLNQAKSIGLQGLSITDHDTIEAYQPELFSQAKKRDIQLLSGVEISSEYNNNTVHVLGYGFDFQSSSFHQFLSQIQRRREERNLAILGKLHAKKMEVTESELRLASQGVIGRPHIAAVMLQKGYVRSIREAFEKFLKEGASCYVSGFKITPLDAIEAIHGANGKAILALRSTL